MRHVLLFFILPSALMAASQDSSDVPRKKFFFYGYGSLNYFVYDWQTDHGRRNAMDLERLTIYPSYRYNPNLSVHAEIEFEHGGTGVTMEFDKFEEFGEFETEVEKGGEVLLEQLNLLFEWKPYFNVRAGRFKLPIGLNSQLDEPPDYFTTTRSETESSILPTNWYEMGVDVFGKFGSCRRWSYHVAVVNGLDATGFSSATWIVRGHQNRFETVNAEDWAVCARLDYEWIDDQFVGLSAYYGNSANNRPKPDLGVDAHVTIVEGHASLQRGPWIVRSIAIYGTLENADEVSEANRNLSNNLNVKRTPVGSAALGIAGEVGFNVLSLTEMNRRLDIFARYEWYDTMFKVSGNVFDNPRWQRSVWTGGANYYFEPKVLIKAQYSARKLGVASSNHENTFSLGLGFEF